jgi:hypothetical protein
MKERKDQYKQEIPDYLGIPWNSQWRISGAPSMYPRHKTLQNFLPFMDADFGRPFPG